jgi:hypothetical protein
MQVITSTEAIKYTVRELCDKDGLEIIKAENEDYDGIPTIKVYFSFKKEDGSTYSSYMHCWIDKGMTYGEW